MNRYRLPEVQCYTIDLLPKWCELDCEEDRIDDFIHNVEQWYDLKTEVWCWAYDDKFEYINAGITGIVFDNADAAADFRDILGYVEQG